MFRQGIVISLAICLCPGFSLGGESPKSEGTKHALLIACTKYPHIHPNDFPAISGPRNSVKLFREVLRREFAFPACQIVTLAEHVAAKNCKPTYANIVQQINSLIERVREGDQVVLLLIGHGSNQPDDDPRGVDEADGLDELFLPQDARSGKGGRIQNAIVDDELKKWITTITSKGAYVWLIVDSCHSGTMLRSSQSISAYVPPDVLIAKQLLDKHQNTRGISGLSLDLIDAPRNRRVVALYAVQPHETTYEQRMPPEGEHKEQVTHFPLTFTVCRILTSAKHLTYRELARQVRQQYVRWGWTQPTPFVEGTDIDRYVLGESGPKGISRILVSSNFPSLKINAGGIHGLTVGSILAVHPPPGAESPQQRLGYVRVTKVKMFDAVVVPVAFGDAPAPTKVPNGGRCKVVSHEYGDRRVPVAIDTIDLSGKQLPSAMVKKLKAAVSALEDEKESFVRLGSSLGRARWVIRVNSNRLFLLPGAGIQRGTRLAEKELAKLPSLYGPISFSETMSTQLRERFRRICRVENLLQLTNTPRYLQYQAELSVSIDMVRYASVDSSDFEVLSSKNGLVVREGDIVGFRIRNESSTMVDATLLFINSEYRIHSFFPSLGEKNNRIGPGKCVFSERRKALRPNEVARMVLIAVGAEAQTAPYDFNYLADDVGYTRSGNQNRSVPLARLLESRLSAASPKRGAQEISDDYVVTSLSWLVMSKEKGKRAFNH